MKAGLLIFMVTAFFLIDAHEDGKYTRLLKSWKKYYKMGGIVLAGVSAYAVLRKNPQDTHGLLVDASQLLKFVPMDKTTASAVAHFMPTEPQGTKRLENSGCNVSPSGTTRRSVSETKKKYVAAQQDWKCSECQNSLPAWFEVDHMVRLDQGGSNHVSNLRALCRDCHGKKTAMENM
jgi:hypothetical protein